MPRYVLQSIDAEGFACSIAEDSAANTFAPLVAHLTAHGIEARVWDRVACAEVSHATV